MSVHSVQNTQPAVQAEALAKAQSAQKQANQQNVVPQDKVTISAEAQGKQTAAAIGANQSDEGNGK